MYLVTVKLQATALYCSEAMMYTDHVIIGITA